MMSRNLRSKLLSAWMLGVLVIVALIHFVLFVLRPQDTAALWFGLFCATMFGRLFVMGLAQEAQLFTSEDASLWLLRLEYLSMPALALTGGTFVYCLVPSQWFYRFVILGLGCGVGSLLALLVVFTQPTTFAMYIPLFQGQIAIGVMMQLILLAGSWRRGDRLAGLLLAAFVSLAFGVIHDILVGQDLLQSTHISPYTTLLYILAQAGIVAGRNEEAHSRAERLGKHLKDEVTLQTVELQEQTENALRLKARAETARLSAEAAQKESDALREQAESDAEKLRELDQQKTTFFQNMSHELRTPLTLILGPLEDESKAQPTNENLKVSTKNARRLLRLVNQLLDFQKLEAGKSGLDLAPLNLNRFTHSLADYFSSACSSKEIAFSVTRDGRELIPEEVVAIQSEPDALEKVTFNFFSNALKYTPHGGTIELGLQSQPKNWARLFVKDSGPGISAEGQTKLFQVFSQVEGSTTREYEGTGLGLALAKSLVEEMGGEVGVESEVGRGSTFFAEFPVVEADAVEQEEFQARAWLLADGGETGIETEVEEEGDIALESEGKGQLVLVVDDLEDMRNLIGNALKKRGYRVLKAANGEQGYKVICDRRPDLVISDWMMPKLSGPDMLKQVRANTDVATTPLILLTAKSDEESKLIGTEIGADAFLGKPFSDIELSSMVRNLLALKAGEKVARQRASLESEVKATLFSEAIHHLNNPLNQIDGGRELMRQDLIDLAESIDMLLTTDPIDPSAEEARIHYESRFQALGTHDSLMRIAVARSVDVVKLLRVVSGVDGVPMERFQMREVCEFLSHRGLDAGSRVFDELTTESLEFTLRGHRALYGQAIEFLVRAGTNQGAMLIGLTAQSGPDGPSLRLEFDQILEPSTTELLKARRLVTYLLESYQPSVETNGPVIVISLGVA